MGMRVDIVTLFPEMCQQVLDASIIGRAAKRGYIETHCHQIRDYTLNKQKQTDDYPYGGGCGTSRRKWRNRGVLPRISCS